MIKVGLDLPSLNNVTDKVWDMFVEEMKSVYRKSNPENTEEVWNKLFQDWVDLKTHRSSKWVELREKVAEFFTF